MISIKLFGDIPIKEEIILEIDVVLKPDLDLSDYDILSEGRNVLKFSSKFSDIEDAQAFLDTIYPVIQTINKKAEFPFTVKFGRVI